jgi:hypothetical protein
MTVSEFLNFQLSFGTLYVHLETLSPSIRFSQRDQCFSDRNRKSEIERVIYALSTIARLTCNKIPALNVTSHRKFLQSGLLETHVTPLRATLHSAEINDSPREMILFTRPSVKKKKERIILVYVDCR